MNQNSKVTRNNLSVYTRGMKIRLSVGNVFVTVPKKSIVELFDLYGNECEVYFSKSIRGYVYFFVVERDQSKPVESEPAQLEIPL